MIGCEDEVGSTPRHEFALWKMAFDARQVDYDTREVVGFCFFLAVRDPESGAFVPLFVPTGY